VIELLEVFMGKKSMSGLYYDDVSSLIGGIVEEGTIFEYETCVEDLDPR